MYYQQSGTSQAQCPPPLWTMVMDGESILTHGSSSEGEVKKKPTCVGKCKGLRGL